LEGARRTAELRVAALEIERSAGRLDTRAASKNAGADNRAGATLDPRAHGNTSQSHRMAHLPPVNHRTFV